MDGDGAVRVREPANVTRFAVYPPALQGAGRRLFIGEQEVRLPRYEAKAKPQGLVFGRHGKGWAYLGTRDSVKLTGKSPGLQGPIDDAFTRPFLCVRGTGQAWNPKVGAWAAANLRRFSYEWNRYFRGDVRVKDDTAVTPDDLRRYNLVLFGDPGSNRWIRAALPKLPIRWTRRELRIGGETYPAADCAPALIQPNPLAGGEGHYLVLNSGHTFHEKELASLNYLLFPRLGDWAVLRVPDAAPASASEPLAEEALRAGFFDEQWRFAHRSP
jgi:hypothetical protein